MADSAAYEIFEVGVQRDKTGKSATRQFLEAWVDFTGGVLGQYKTDVTPAIFRAKSQV